MWVTALCVVASRLSDQFWLCSILDAHPVGTVLPVGVVKALQNKCATASGGTRHSHPGWVSRCGVSPLTCERGGERNAGVLAMAGHRLWRGPCSGAPLQRGRLRQRLCKGILLVRCCARRDALLAWGVLRGKQTLSRRDVPLSMFTKSSYIMHKSRER